MATDRRYKVTDQLKKGLQWLVWKPLRLVIAVVVILAIWIVASSFGGDNSDVAGSPSSSPTPTSDMPSAWQEWPTAGAATPSALDISSPTIPAPTTPSPAPQTTAPSDERPVWDDMSRKAALDTGVAAIEAYISGDQAALDKLLGWDIAITVHLNIVTVATPNPDKPGAPIPHIENEASPLTTTVIVPTSGGNYQVGITRWSATDPWLVQTITEPSN